MFRAAFRRLSGARRERAGSSAVEHSTFNRMVEGSIPSRPTNSLNSGAKLASHATLSRAPCDPARA